MRTLREHAVRLAESMIKAAEAAAREMSQSATPLSVRCPFCGSQPGWPCLTRGWRYDVAHKAHKARVAKWQRDNPPNERTP